MSTKLILGIVLLIAGGALMGTTMYLGTYIDDALDEGIEDARLLNPEEMNETEDADEDDFYISFDDKKRYFLYNVTNTTADSNGEFEYEKIGPIRLNKTKHRLVLSSNETKNTVTFADFAVSIEYYNETFEAMKDQNVTMFNTNWFIFHALNGEYMVAAEAHYNILNSTSFDRATWNMYMASQMAPMDLNTTDFASITTGAQNITDPTTCGYLYMVGQNTALAPTIAGTPYGMGLTIANLTTLSVFTYNAVETALVDDGLSMYATHTIDEWLFGWNSDILGMKAPGLLSSKTYTDAEVLAMSDTERYQADNMDVWKVKTGEGSIKNVGNVIEIDGVNGLSWQPLVAAQAEYNWTNLTHKNVKWDTAWWPGVEKDDEPLYVWDTTLGRGELDYVDEIEIKGIDTLRFGLEGKRNLTEGILYSTGQLGLLLSGSDTVYNPFHYIGTGHVYTDVEPLTGIAFNASKYFDFAIYSPSTNETYRSFIVHEYGAIEDDDAEDFKDEVYGAQDLADNVPMYGMIGGVGIIALGAVVIALGKR